LLIDTDDPLGQGQTIAAPLVAATIDEPELPDEPMPKLQWKAQRALNDPRVLLADAQQALSEMRAERDEARRVADTLAIALREEQQLKTNKIAHAVLERIGSHVVVRSQDVAAIVDAVVGRLGNRLDQAVVNAVVGRLGSRLDQAKEENHQLVAAWGRYLAGQITELTTEVRGLAARVERIDQDR
jgi:F0F1-type ATP synthase membrane subunit b/b'